MRFDDSNTENTRLETPVLLLQLLDLEQLLHPCPPLASVSSCAGSEVVISTHRTPGKTVTGTWDVWCLFTN